MLILTVAVFQAEGRACPERSRRDLAWRPAACSAMLRARSRLTGAL